MSYMIETKHLTKKFGTFTAVDDISISVNKGEIYGFLGLNGAGKTTTIRMLLGMVRPSKGECRLDGIRIAPGMSTIWNRVGYLVEMPYSYPELTVRENLELTRRLRFVEDAGAVDAIMELLNIGHYSDRQAKKLSLGNAQRLGLAKAMIHQPELLFLDEPANGLDPAGIVEIRELLHSLAKERGVTILISSHLLGEISRFATRIGIIHHGRMLQELDTGNLPDVVTRKLVVRTGNNLLASSILAERGIESTVTDDDSIQIISKDAIGHSATVNELLVRAGCTPSVVRIDEEDLESYFLRTIEGCGGVR
jgi:ABC-2 type transport system ATP-binding protein